MGMHVESIPSAIKLLYLENIAGEQDRGPCKSTSNTIAGYPEISYFISNYFMEKVSAENKEAFDGVRLYNDIHA